MRDLSPEEHISIRTVTGEEAQAELRRTMKTISLGLTYGMSSAQLVRNINGLEVAGVILMKPQKL